MDKEKLKEWPKKMDEKKYRNKDYCRGAEYYNLALDECLKVHQRIIAEKDKEIAELTDKLAKARKCDFCGGTDMICEKGWIEERCGLIAERDRYREALVRIKDAGEIISTNEYPQAFNKMYLLAKEALKEPNGMSNPLNRKRYGVIKET